MRYCYLTISICYLKVKAFTTYFIYIIRTLTDVRKSPLRRAEQK